MNEMSAVDAHGVGFIRGAATVGRVLSWFFRISFLKFAKFGPVAVLVVSAAHGAEFKAIDPFERIRQPKPVAVPDKKPPKEQKEQKEPEAPASRFPAQLTRPAQASPEPAEPAPEVKPIAKSESKPDAKSQPAVRVTGRLLADIRSISKSQADESLPGITLFDVRRARIDVRGAMPPNIKHKVSFDLVETVKVKDAYIDVASDEAEDLKLRAGQFQTAIPGENVESSLNYEFIEGSTLGSALTGGYDRGLSVMGNQFDKRFFYSVAATNGTGARRPDANKSMEYILQFQALPFSSKDEGLHVWAGASYSTSKRESSVKETLELLPETESAFSLFKVELPNDKPYSRSRLSVDAKLLYQSLTLAAEYLAGDYTYEQKVAVTGGYAMVGYFLTGEQRSVSEGFFDRQSVIDPVTSATGKGAWELAFRYSWFNVGDNFFQDDGLYDGWKMLDDTKNARSGTAQTYAVNWYPTKQTRLMLNWVRTATLNYDTESEILIPFKKESTWLLRGQIEF